MALIKKELNKHLDCLDTLLPKLLDIANSKLHLKDKGWLLNIFVSKFIVNKNRTLIGFMTFKVFILKLTYVSNNKVQSKNTEICGEIGLCQPYMEIALLDEASP